MKKKDSKNKILTENEAKKCKAGLNKELINFCYDEYGGIPLLSGMLKPDIQFIERNFKKNMKKSAGLAIVCNKKILLAHPTNAPWMGRHGIPKGEIEKGETSFQAANRETWEEIGLIFFTGKQGGDRFGIVKPEEYHVNYTNKKGKTYKRVYYFIVEIEKEIDTRTLNFQIEEVDQAAFYTYKEAKEVILPKQIPILKQLKNDSYL